MSYKAKSIREPAVNIHWPSWKSFRLPGLNKQQLKGYYPVFTVSAAVDDLVDEASDLRRRRLRSTF